MNQPTSHKPAICLTSDPSIVARQRMLSRWGEPLFIADWQRVLMIHFEVDPEALQRDVPFQLDLRDGRAFVSLVAFTMHGMHPRFGGGFSAWIFRPIATHDFLNVRTYVRYNDEPGIHFLAEWLSSRLASKLGPVMFGLPYRHGQIAYQHNWRKEIVRGQVTDPVGSAKFVYHMKKSNREIIQPCQIASLDEWLMERYTAFNSAGGWRRFFRVWHQPWPQCSVEMEVKDNSLLTRTWDWFRDARLVGANYSPGLNTVWMGRPHWVGRH